MAPSKLVEIQLTGGSLVYNPLKSLTIQNKRQHTATKNLLSIHLLLPCQSFVSCQLLKVSIVLLWYALNLKLNLKLFIKKKIPQHFNNKTLFRQKMLKIK